MFDVILAQSVMPNGNYQLTEILMNPLSWFFGFLTITSVLGTIAHHMQKMRQAELDASLKMEMLQRGMTPTEIEQVLRASTSSRPSKVH